MQDEFAPEEFMLDEEGTDTELEGEDEEEADDEDKEEL